MKIDPLSGPRAQSIKRKARGGANGSAFADALKGDNEPAAQAAGAPGVAGLDSLLTIQEAPDALCGRAKARKRGDQLLDELDRIRVGLLMGRIPLAGLRRLQILLGEARPQADDARVEQVLAEIETRAAVELAKLGQ
ncbi:flagellar assembly protein FliX [Algihabitans albus]|uniref:flagellar assembly protein FliX n=1 Tax=Algihabitans albus TaxID=2164067 RepID=UPI000E5C5EF2|nr:flagellar assembly protein FliX [Algihabitans albus]